MACNSPSIVVVLVGDSDIARWPKDLLPSITDTTTTPPTMAAANTCPKNMSACLVSGHSGALLHQIIVPVQEQLTAVALANKEQRNSYNDKDQKWQTTTTPVFLIVCAGENDIASGMPLTKSISAMESLLQTVCSMASTTSQYLRVHLIFLGPKLEPWLRDDPDARKAYIQMSRSFARICSQYINNSSSSITSIGSIHFVDCLTLFCDGANSPGALFGGCAVPHDEYFDDDQLHLSYEGYRRWRDCVESKMRTILYGSSNNTISSA